MVYLDNNATTALDPRVLEAMMPYLTGPYGNPSSVHRFGKASRAAIDIARQQVASLVGAQASEVVFTSGGTEANNFAIKGVAHANRDKQIIYSAVEHPCVLEPAEQLQRAGWPVAVLSVNEQGVVDLARLESLLLAKPTSLVSVMTANNENGAIQPIAEIADMARASGALLHTDAVQAAGKLAVDFTDVDLMSLSAHKIYGPKGAGALLLRKTVYLEPLLHGGGQEGGLRSGTENLAAIVGFGAAASLALAEREERSSHCLQLQAAFEAGLGQWSDIQVFSAAAPRLANTVQISVPGIDGETLLMLLDQRGVAVSSGSACHAGSGEPSHVLLAMGVNNSVARGAIRISFGKENSQADVDACLKAVAEIRGGA
ncbi:MAG: cysteine desulfurase [Pseudoalteromonas tetraodonis]|jgi:cysteine desulfurase